MFAKIDGVGVTGSSVCDSTGDENRLDAGTVSEDSGGAYEDAAVGSARCISVGVGNSSGDGVESGVQYSFRCKRRGPLVSNSRTCFSGHCLHSRTRNDSMMHRFSQQHVLRSSFAPYAMKTVSAVPFAMHKSETSDHSGVL